MKYFFDYEIKYQEVDAAKRLRLPDMENYLLEVAGTVADQLGFGIIRLHPERKTWVLTRLSLIMNYMPTYLEKMTIETWIESQAHMLSTRDFRIYITGKDGVRRQIGECTSQWAVLDMDKREIVNIFDRPMFDGAIDGEKLDIPRASRLMPITEPTGVVSHVVQYTDVDYNDHCNSCKYLEAIVNAAKPDYLGKRIRLDINYQREMRLGEQIDTLYLELPDGIQYQQKNANGETSCAAKITILA